MSKNFLFIVVVVVCIDIVSKKLLKLLDLVAVHGRKKLEQEHQFACAPLSAGVIALTDIE